jgi:hypothetical protein
MEKRYNSWLEGFYWKHKLIYGKNIPTDENGEIIKNLPPEYILFGKTLEKNKFLSTEVGYKFCQHLFFLVICLMCGFFGYLLYISGYIGASVIIFVIALIFLLASLHEFYELIQAIKEKDRFKQPSRSAVIVDGLDTVKIVIMVLIILALIVCGLRGFGWI